MIVTFRVIVPDRGYASSVRGTGWTTFSMTDVLVMS